MLNINEITEALRLLSLDGRYYRVHRFAMNPDLFNAIVIAASYHGTTLTIQTDKGLIKLSDFEEFTFFPDGGVQVFQNESDDRPVLELVANHMDDDYLLELNAANSRLGREGRTWPEGLEAH